MYANLLLHYEPQNSIDRKCQVQAMLDTGCGFELVIPARKAVQLRLEVVNCCETKGYGGQCVQMLEFKPI